VLCANVTTGAYMCIIIAERQAAQYVVLFHIEWFEMWRCCRPPSCNKKFKCVYAKLQ